MDIYYACRIGDLQAVQHYVERGADLALLDRYGNMCLYYAILCGHPPVVEYLFDQGVKVLLDTPEGSRYYLCACRQDVRNIVRKRGQRDGAGASKSEDSTFYRLCLDAPLPELRAALPRHRAHISRKHKTGFNPIE